MIKRVYCICYVLIASLNVFAQSDAQKGYPIIGERCPDFTFTDVVNYTSNHLSLQELKGKYVILDFWAESCVSCIQGFPKMSKLQEKYRDRLSVVLVGLDSRNIRAVFNRMDTKYHLGLISAYDTILHTPPFKPNAGVPWYVWIDNEGTVQAVTGSSEVTEENIQKFIAGEQFSYSDQSYEAIMHRREVYTMESPLLIDGNGGTDDTDFLYRSLLTKWKPGMGASGETMDVFLQSGKPRYEALCVNPFFLLQVAYLDQKTKHAIEALPIIEATDSVRFTGDADETYCYSVSVPKDSARPEQVMKVMQSDLKNYFNVEASVEERDMPCLLLTIVDNKKFNKIKSRDSGQPPKEIERGYGLEYANANINAVAVALKYHWGKYDLLKIYNETGYTGNINLRINALRSDMEEVRKALNASGLDVVPAYRKSKVFVIRDAKN